MLVIDLGEEGREIISDDNKDNDNDNDGNESKAN